VADLGGERVGDPLPIVRQGRALDRPPPIPILLRERFLGGLCSGWRGEGEREEHEPHARAERREHDARRVEVVSWTHPEYALHPADVRGRRPRKVLGSYLGPC